jgi:hypothetical protein
VLCEQRHIHAWYEWWTIGPELSIKTLKQSVAHKNQYKGKSVDGATLVPGRN